MSRKETDGLMQKLDSKNVKSEDTRSPISRQQLIKILSDKQEREALDDLTRIVDKYGFTASNWHGISDQIETYIANNATTKKEE